MNKNFNHWFRHTNNVLNYFQRHGKKYLFGTLWAFAIVKMALLFVWFFSTLDLGKSFAQTPVVLTSGNIVSEYGCDTTATQCDFKGITSIESDAFVNHTQLQDLFLAGNQLTSIDWVVFPENLQNLNLYNNQLTSIDWVVFPNSLQTLFLDYNQLTSLPETIKQLVNLIGNKWLQIYYNRIDYHQLSKELLSFVDQKTDGDWRATQQIEVLWCTDPRANNYNPNATKNDWSCDYSVDQQWDFSIDGSFLLKEMLAEAKVYSGGLLPFSIEAAYSGQRSSATIYVWVPFDFNFDYTLPFKSPFSGDSKIVYGWPGDWCYADFIKWTGKYVDHIDNLIETLLASLLNCDGYPEKDCQINIPDLYPEPILLKHSAEILASSGMKAWAWAIVDALNLLWTVKQKEDFITVSKIVKEYLSNGIPASSIMSQVCVFFWEYSLESCPIFEALWVALWLDKIENCGAKVYSYDQELYYDTREATFFWRHPYVAGWFDINLFISSDETIDMDISNNTKTIHIDMTEWEWMSCTNSSETINILDGNIGEAYVNPSDYWFWVKDEKKKIEDPNMKEEEEQARKLRGLAKAKISDCEPVFLWCLDGDSYLIADWLFPVWTGEVYHNDSCKHPIRPIASNLNIFGEVTVGSKLLGTYDFTYNNWIWNNLFEIQKWEIRHLVISPNWTPMIAYNYWDWYSNQLVVAEYTNWTWNQLWDEINWSIGQLVLSPNWTPIIAYNYWDWYSNQLVVAEYTNWTWNQLWDEINWSIGHLVISPNWTPIIAYHNWSLGQSFVAEYSSLWEWTSTYQRYRDGKPIVWATDIEYAITSSDLGHTLFFEVEPESEDRVLWLKVMSEWLYIPKPQTSNKWDLGGWWGAWWYLIKDNCCLNWGLLWWNELCKDYSDSYYDWTCKWWFHESADICGINKSNYSDELKLTYLYSYNYGITTICPIRDAKLDGYLYRNHFAKMISEYAINVMWKKPDVWKKWCDQFQDIEKESDELKYFMKTACELNLMWLHPDWKTPKDNFDPNDIVTRAEFWTVFSRLLFGDKYNIKDDNLLNKNEWYWYKDHLAWLKTNGIMTKIDNPKSKELRGWTMLMLMRAWKILKNK